MGHAPLPPSQRLHVTASPTICVTHYDPSIMRALPNPYNSPPRRTRPGPRCWSAGATPEAALPGVLITALHVSSNGDHPTAILPFYKPLPCSSPGVDTGEGRRTGGREGGSERMKGQSANIEALEGDFCKENPLPVGCGDVSSSSSSTTSPHAADGARRPMPAVFASGYSSVIGLRKEMEDFVSLVPGFLSVWGESHDFFAVYDGHGGAKVAEACRDRMHVVVAEEAAMEAPPPAVVGHALEEWWKGVMERSFQRVDDEVAALGKMAGSTALVAVIGPRSIVVANCGDCRAVICRDAEALPLSSDHKPTRKDELERIEASGGRVVNWRGYRVLGVLAMSRSIGDYDLKPYVVPTPELTVIERTERDEFLILASDGLWDVISNNAACRLVRSCLTGRKVKKHGEAVSGHRAGRAAARLTKIALSMRSTDNVSVVVVQLTNLQANGPAEDAIGPRF